MIGDCANCKSHICAGRGISCKKINQDEVIDLYTDEEKKIMRQLLWKPHIIVSLHV